MWFLGRRLFSESSPLYWLFCDVLGWTILLMWFLTVVLLKTNATATSTDVASVTQRTEYLYFPG